MPVKILPDFVVRNHPTLANGTAATTGLADGGFVVIWHEYEDAALSHTVWGQLYNVAGQPKGARFVVENGYNTSPRFSEVTDPLVATLPGGGFAVTFESTFSIPDDGTGALHDNRVSVHVLDANGTGAMSPSAAADLSGVVHQYYNNESITALADGRFVVVWYDPYSGVPSMRAQIYSPGGDKVGGLIVVANGKFQRDNVTGSIAGTIDLPEGKVTALAGGGFVVTWQENTRGTDPGYNDTIEIKARVYNANGTAAGSEVTVADASEGAGHLLLTAASGDGFLAWWQNSAGKLVAQRFTEDGTETGSEIEYRVPNAFPTLTALADGRLVVTWSEGSPSTQSGNIKAQVFDSNGTAAGDSFKVNSTTAGSQLIPVVAALSDGRFAVTYQSNNESPTVASSKLRTAIVDPYIFDGDTGNDSWIGGKWSDTMDGYAGDDTFKGMGGVDILNGDSGNDTLRGGTGGDKLNGGLGKDVLYGNSGNDSLKGSKGDDKLYGGDGKDTLIGGVGDDTLFGGGGNDRFLYTAVDPGKDTVTFFSRGTDKFVFEGSMFGLGSYTGTLRAPRFDVGTDNVADRTSERFIFNVITDQLWYDSNGSTAGGLRVMIAEIENNVTLSASDILII